MWIESSSSEEKTYVNSMDSKLIKQWMSQGLRPSSFEFFTNRPNLVIGKLADRPAQAEYVCPFCGFNEIKEIEMEKGKRKFKRPEFECSKCKKMIEVPGLKKTK